MESKLKFYWTKDTKNDDIYLSPPKGKHKETLIWLHGLGDSAEGYYPAFNSPKSPALESTRIVLLTAPSQPVTINMGMVMPSWFDIKTMAYNVDYEKMFSKKDIIDNAKRIHRVMNEEIVILNGNSKKIFVGGFSQGGGLALYSGLQFDKPIGGIMSFSGFYFPFIKEEKCNEETPILIYHGLKDNLVPWTLYGHAYDLLDKTKHKVQIELDKDLFHSMSDIGFNLMKSFLRKESI